MRLSLIPVLFGVLAASVPTEEQAASHREDKRQLGSLLGIFNRDATFDYVIIGGGTAGLTLVNRLSANRDITVAVIEAGSFYQITNPALGQTPAGDTIFAGSSPSDTNPLVDWNFVTEPQAGAGNRKIHYARGKCLGGSSARNFMVYQRGTKQSYQKWADAVGDDRYTWDALQRHFQRSARLTAPAASRFANASAAYNAAAFSPAGGPLQVSYANYAQPFSTWLEPALNEIGVADADDFNSGALLGAQYCASTIDPKTQTRDSSQTSFLRDAQGRSNLKVYTATLARKIVFDGAKRATGVVLEYISAPGYVGAFTNLLTTQPRDGYQYATILGALVAPLSRGTVTLRSADAKDLPLINPNWLTDPTDVAVAIATYKRLRAAFATDAMKGVLVGGGEYFPGAAVQTDAQILNTIRETVMTVWHAACTCRMGKKDDPMAVVDSNAKVIGVQGLRVVDASSFALLPPGHPQSTVYVLAEKIAAEILEAP
ncbi:hypothetical protein BN1708_009656, partial [Verticillium longisporum]